MAFAEQLLPVGLVAPDLKALHGREQLVFLVLHIRGRAFDCRFQMVGCGPQFRPLENYARGLRDEVFARCSQERLQRLGFAAWSSYGHTGDPEALVTEDGTQACGELHVS